MNKRSLTLLLAMTVLLIPPDSQGNWPAWGPLLSWNGLNGDGVANTGATCRGTPPTPTACPEAAEGPAPVCQVPDGHTTGRPDLTARVVRVIDGDTVILEGGERLRYLGVDTPELNECYGREAFLFNANLVKGKTLALYFDRQKRDRYQRLLAYAFLTDGTFVNAWLVRQGYATTWILSPNIARGVGGTPPAILDAENVARAAGRGLWTACR